MVYLNLSSESHLITIESIDRLIGKKKIGNYILGYLVDKIFYPKYVGRSDTDLNVKLKEYIDSKYKRFRFLIQTSAKNAFLKECENYHDFRKSIDNTIHPARPKGTEWKCPKNCKEEY
jgi:hypothetical protein